MTQAAEGKVRRDQPSARRILAVIAGIIGLVVVVVFILGYRAAWDNLAIVDCRHNLRQVSVPLREYAETNNGHFPSTWVELNFVGEYTNWAKALHCPRAGHNIGKWTQVDLWADYRLIPGRTTNNSADTILAIEPLSNHGATGANVLFVDGSTQWWSASRVLDDSVESVINKVIK